jgi:hexulose-6-phosphate isomerase
MQGRLTPHPPGRLQVFPTDWPRELEAAARLGFAFVEWLLLPEGTGNPFDTESGRREIRKVSAATGIAVTSVCAARCIREPLTILPAILDAAADIGASRVLVPLLEEAHVDTPAREDEALKHLAPGAAAAARTGVTLALEMAWPGDDCARFLRRLSDPHVALCYDTGNQTALGLDVAVDVVPVLGMVEAVHIKDRRTGGGSVPLGSGETNFSGFFRALKQAGYRGDIVLEHFYDADPAADAERALRFVREHLRDAGL